MTGPSGVEEGLWARLVARARQRAEGAEPAHDWFHVERVVANAITIATSENANVAIAATAALLHELFNLPKSHPDSSSAGDVCAEHARAVLLGEGAPADIVEPVVSAIRDHAFSKAVIPEALESRVLQDADRLDAIGAIGLARMWATCAEMKRPFYAPDDPFCATRPPDDKSWGLDHVFKKLLVVPERLHLPTSRRLADGRVRFLRDFVEQLRSEIAPVHGANALAATANRPDAATLAQIVDRAPDGIVASRDGVVLYANDAAALLLGHTTPASLVGQSMATFLDAESLSTMRRRIQQIGEGDRLVPREYAAKRRDGSPILAEIASAIIDWNGAGGERRQAVLAFARVVTERSRLRAELAHTDRLAAMGVIAAGVAHEINNPLGFMQLATEVIERKLSSHPPPPDLRQLVRDMRDGIHRIGAIVRDLRVFGRYEDEPLGAVDVGGAIDTAARIVGHELVPRARLRREEGPLPAVVGITTRLEQVFVNLLLNAAFGFPDGGQLGTIVVRGLLEGELVIIEVTDDGPGIAPAVLDRIFDPFFSARPAGNGTGLGLSICRGIVERSGGTLTASSVVGKGTTMRIVLPRANVLATTGSRPTVPPRRPVRRLRVLVVDDEARIVELVRGLLESEHDVVTATDPWVALGLLLEPSTAKFDVVLCDLVMPQLSGIDLHERVARVDPTTAARFVFVSGGPYTERARAAFSIKTRLMKPFSATDLLTAITEATD